jgi:hypothetical protein
MHYERAQEKIKRLETDVAELRRELEMRNVEVEAARSRLTGVELVLRGLPTADGLQGMPGLDAADIRRLRLEYQTKTSESDEPMELFEETVRMLEELDSAFQQFDYVAFGFVADRFSST